MTGPTAYSQRIADALAQADPALTINGVKSAVAAELQELDPTMTVETTQYFNHSFAPDFVVAWPSVPSLPKRFVYLKISSQLDYLLEDVELVSDQHPIVFGLSPTPTGAVSLIRQMRETTQRTNTLVTDAYGLEELIDRKENAFVNLTSSAVAQAGRGVIDQSRGSATAHKLQAGFEGALAIDSGRTLAATETLDELLDAKYADRMTRLLQAVWVGAGGRLEDFPSDPGHFDADIADEALQFLLEYEEIDDRRFWERLGKQVTIPQLGRLRLPNGSVNLEHFIRANIHSLSARACRVLDSHQPTLNSENDRDTLLQWFVENDRKLLALRGTDFTALFGPNVSDLRPVRRERISGIDVRELVSRAKYSMITEADLSSFSGGRRTLKLISDDRSNLIEDLAGRTTFPELGQGFRVLVKRAGVALGGSGTRVLSCDFQTATAYRRTSSKISLAELIREGIPLLHDLSRDDLNALIKMTRAEGAFDLFDLPPTEE
jgi:hypothetical protein